MESDKVVQCQLCGKEATIINSQLPGYQEPDLYQIYHCPTCCTDFSFPRVDTTMIYDHIYNDAKNVPGYDRYWRFMKMIKKSKNPLNVLSNVEDTYWGVKEALLKVVADKDAKKILEVGSGLGYLTYSLRRAGYDIIGMDISETAVNQAKTIFGDFYICADLFKLAPLQAESFDVVILTEVIEHVNRPLEFLDSIKQLLKPGGHVIITTPNKSLFPTEIIWATDLPPVHCWWFSEESIIFAAKVKDFNIEFINFRKFYKKNPLTIDLHNIRSENSHKPTLNKNGKIVEAIKNKKNSTFFSIRSFIYKFPPFKKGYNIFLRIFKKDILSCDERGYILCAILQKKG